MNNRRSSVTHGDETSRGRGHHSLPALEVMRFALARPLGVFGEAFEVELSTSVTLSPATLLRAAIGKSLQTLLRERGKLLPIRQFQYGLLGRHQLSSTTLASVQQALGPTAARRISHPDLEAASIHSAGQSQWICLTQAWAPVARDNPLDVAAAEFAELDKLVDASAALAAAGEREAAEEMFGRRFDRTMPEWRLLCPHLALQACFLLDSSLLVLARVEAVAASVSAETQGLTFGVPSLLAPPSKPIGNWLRELASTAKCANNRELADLLARNGMCHRGGLPIAHDTLKAWAAMRPGMLMTLKACNSLLGLIGDPQEAGRLRSRFALARFLAFLCDLLRSSVGPGSPPWADAQTMLMTRFQQISAAEGQQRHAKDGDPGMTQIPEAGKA